MNLTVMGPGVDSAPSLYAPPRLQAKTDKFVWRQAVRVWAQKIRSFAKGGDTKAKGIANSLGITLYSAMDYSFVQVIDSAITAGEFKLVADDDDENEVINQMELIEKIIKLVAKDSVTDGVRRLVKMSQNVHACNREKNETYEAFAERFRGVAQTYLNHCYAGNTSQDSQNFAMLLLENAKLPSSTFNNIVSILIADAKDKTRLLKKFFNIPREKFSAIEKSFETAINLWNRFHIQPIPSEQQQLTVTKQQVQASWDDHKLSIDNAKSNKDRQGKEDRVPYAITLEDAVAALKDIKSMDVPHDDKPNPVPDTPAPAAPHTTAEYKNSGGAHRGTMLTKRSDYQGRNDGVPFESRGSRFRFRTRIPANTGPKSKTRCVDCGELGHWRGDPECKARRDNKRVRFDAEKVKNDADKPSGQYFQ